ncbi:mitogen-activated protein kinase kinase kinase 15 isoform X1 [Formica exsecta]|uniref:mitogen-activated protein kinase kinase kinase 15 isoform X1 n=2 Tax=Formica exsecta TaxID=72781 RepID=UPI001144AB37|nr:mitogen-activated protein kinase kinase kinase 15 isoform X1 [Formica exsecta]XP_029659589.1 mitogen-activated protein kinase kinase kinase 15 isoform X1 [Formica exsecta]XP_029659590.1 mitogen-activated protein kinase kinase kinase 15 isoform X1 [Formica exsecta]XP_029659592.1 mitogen-activated protein kinase kinase kinase 15 isoform X1 [Formica exsecta]XP_029659593.1 mitogen-activated protein kinase kinase kinase 15 isoform X1 [Formica exsecta]XP_029659594.1 mitogen-activated protein kina
MPSTCGDMVDMTATSQLGIMEGISSTDSVGTQSDISGHTTVPGRPRMDVACVLDLQQPEHLAQRKKTLDEVRQACNLVNANIHHIQFEKLDFGETNVLDTFYNADVAVVDLSIQLQQSALFYHLGVRESFGMKENILLYNDVDTEATIRLKLSCGSYTFVSYRVVESCGSCVATNPATSRITGEEAIDPKQHLTLKLKKLLQDVEIQSKAHMKEKFLADLRKARETYSGEELSRTLNNMRKRLDDPNVLSGEVVLNVLISFREIQDYDAMVQLVDDLKTIPTHKNYINTPAIRYLYAFALNRRNKEGDRERALKVIEKALEKKENHVPDMLCLCGRIYKDKFVESRHTDQESLKNAIHWYRKGFEVQPNEYAGINLATLLVIAGNEFSKSEELQHIGMVLNNLIGKKGSLSSLKDYWDVATFFEISVLAEDYSKAIQAALCMFKLKPPNWYLKSTIGNISLINRFRKKNEEAEIAPEEQIFSFWMDYFVEATKAEVGDSIWFPILVLEPTKILMPSYVNVNLGAEEKSIHIRNLCNSCLDNIRNNCKQVHDWLFTANMIRSMSLYKRDERCLFLYVHQNSDDFQMYLPSVQCRQRFYDLILEMTRDQEGMVTDLDAYMTDDCMKFEYELDDQNKRIILGKGTYGIVYAARDLNTQVRIAVKEIRERNLGDVQPLHEEIKLHSQLRHRNIVQYLGSVSEDGYFKIFMEQVPGGSLSALLRLKWGPLKENESTISYYTKQMLEGLKYLHDQKIVHRDIKGDNVLVNTYSGVVKISDFGMSKRLAGLCPSTETFTGTLQYMAPEVIDKGQRGYGAPADIWSLGCTIVEMATGKPPFIELGSPQAAVFKVGYYKIHPEIPSELSERAKSFILRCFEPNPDIRATAAELLEDPFLNEKKKSSRLAAPPDFSRSISVPADRLERLGKCDKTNDNHIVAAISMQISQSDDSGGLTKSSPLRERSPAHLLSPISMPTAILSFNSTIGNTPSIDTSESDIASASITRRSSSGGLLSPEVELGGQPGQKSGEEQEGFYLLKKDSQRRMTLTRVLNQDEAKICEVWMRGIHQAEGQTVLQMSQLVLLMRGLRDYIAEQNQEVIVTAIRTLKEELDFDSTAINHLHLAIYLFQTAANEVLRMHSIKPHWMFALDNLVRNAVQAAITVLSPELGANLLGQERVQPGGQGPEEESTSGVSTVNSVKSQKTADSIDNKYWKEYKDQMGALKMENMKLLQELIESQKAYQTLLQQALEEQRAQVNTLTHLCENISRRAVRQESGYNSCISPISQQSTSLTITDTHNSIPLHSDMALVDWLRNLQVDDISIDRFLYEEYTLEDILCHVTRDDLRRLNLRGGIELRIWQAIQRHKS